jgi:hypothetical protein
MVRKSALQQWFEHRNRSAREAIDAVVADVAQELEQAEPVELPADEFALWMTVELQRSRASTPDELDRLLLNEFGSKSAVREATATAMRVDDRLRRQAETLGRRVSPVLPADDLASEEKRLLEARARGILTLGPRFRFEDIARYSATRSWEMGFKPSVIWAIAPAQERRSAASAKERDARARIVVELRDLGATLTEIGEVFGGRKKQSVGDLERAGRKAASSARPIDPKRIDDYRAALKARPKKQRPKGGTDG